MEKVDLPAIRAYAVGQQAARTRETPGKPGLDAKHVMRSGIGPSMWAHVPTVSDLLTLDIFRKAEAEVIAGQRNLGARVRWVHIAEMLNVAHLLKGGELLLTTGMGLRGEGPARQVEYVAELKRAGVAGVVIELGRTLPKVPPSVARAAETDGIPLIVLHRETRYVEITEQVHAAIINRHYQLLERADEIAQTFTELLLLGGTRTHIVHRLADLVDNLVVLEDGAHQIVEFAPESEAAAAIVDSWHSHSRQAHAAGPGEGLKVRLEKADPPCAWLPITVRAQPWGRLHMLAVNKPFDDLDRLALERTAAVINLSLLSEQAIVHWSEQARGALIFDLMQGKYLTGDDVLRRARSASVDLEGLRLAAVVVDSIGLADYLNERKGSDLERQQAVRQISALLRTELDRGRCRGVVACDGDRVLALVGVKPTESAKAALTLVGERVASRMKEWMPGVRVTIGVSQEASPETAHRAFKEALEAAQRGRHVGAGCPVHHYSDFGLEDLILRTTERADVARLVEGELGPILEHDATAAVPLLPTLRTYLKCRNVQAAARALNIERRSLYHRLARVTDLLGHDLDDPDQRMRLWLALRSLDILALRPSSSAPIKAAKASTSR